MGIFSWHASHHPMRSTKITLDTESSEVGHRENRITPGVAEAGVVGVCSRTAASFMA